jgi:bifunctional enzyme CysN/CysC
MDLVGYSAARFEEIREEFRTFAMKLEVTDLTFIPTSALTGDNVVSRSSAMPWYDGNSLLHHLEELHVSSDRNLIDARLPVQYVIRPQQMDFRGYAGAIAGGIFRPGDEVIVLPGGFGTTVTRVWGPGGTRLEEAYTGQSVTVELADDIDAGRGDMICRPKNRPHSGQNIEAMLCWLDAGSTLSAGTTYGILHTTRETRASVKEIDYRLDVNTLHRDQSASGLSLNEIGRIRLRAQTPLHFDPYRRNRDTGSFILIDEATNNTVAAGMILRPSTPEATIAWNSAAVTREQRLSQGATLWFTGLSGSGKSSVAMEIERRLVAAGRPAYVLDGDNLRHGLNADLAFSPEDRVENVRRVAEVARLLADAGMVAIVSLVSPYRADRDQARAIHAAAGLPFLEIFMATSLEVAEARDAKGLYTRARDGEILDFTGVSAPYEAPLAPDLMLRPDDGDVAAMAALVLGRLG